MAETADLQDIAEMSDLDVCIQEIKEVIEEHREMHKEVLTGRIAALLLQLFDFFFFSVFPLPLSRGQSRPDQAK